MVSCGSIKDKPGRDPISGFMILLYVALTLIFIATLGSCWGYIKTIGDHKVGSIFSFICDGITLAAIVFVMIGYFKPSDKFLKQGFVILLITGLFDICLFIFGVLQKIFKHFTLTLGCFILAISYSF